MTNALAPSLLAAPPSLSDPNFKGAVVAIAAHENNGAMGFIISRKTSLTLYELLKDLSIEPEVEDRKVLFGGPVSPNAGFVLYEHEPNLPMGYGLTLCDTVSISPSREILEMAAKGQLPGRFEFILGYAGWGPGQLEDEIDGGGWFHTSFTPQMVFDTPVKDRWKKTYLDHGISPFRFITVPGGAQA